MFSPVQNKKIYKDVVNQIQQKIFKGQLKKGDKLPNEEELVSQLKISLDSVKETLRVLEVTGLIEINENGESYISGTIEDTLLEPLSAMFFLNNGTPKDILELRTIIEVNASRLAAQRITEDQKAKLFDILDALGHATLEGNKAETDIYFHYYIAEITGNPLITNVLSIISSILDNFIQTNRTKILANPNNEKMLFNSHEDIVEAITNHDPDRAAAAMQKHMDMINVIVFPT